MPQGRTLHVTLSEDKLNLVRSKVESGEFHSESEVLEAYIADLQRREHEVEEWLREVAVPAYERILADPSRGIPVEQVEEFLEVGRGQRRAKERIRFEQEEVIPAHDEWMADSSSAIPIDQVRRDIAAARERLEKTRG